MSCPIPWFPQFPSLACTPIVETTWAHHGVFYVPSPSPLNQRQWASRMCICRNHARARASLRCARNRIWWPMSAVIFHGPAKTHTDSSGNACWRGRFVVCRLSAEDIRGLAWNWNPYWHSTERASISLDSPPCHPGVREHVNRTAWKTGYCNCN